MDIINKLINYITMPPEERQVKTVICADRIGEANRLMYGQNLAAMTSDEGVQELFAQLSDLCIKKEFARGIEGTAEKQEFSRNGGYIVQAAVTVILELAADGTASRIKQLVTNRIDPSHHVMRDESTILLSGGASDDPQEILDRKIILPEGIDIAQTSPMAIGTQVRKEITYLFMIHVVAAQTKKDKVPTGTKHSNSKNRCRFVHPKTALWHVRKNEMELGIMAKIFRELEQ